MIESLSASDRSRVIEMAWEDRTSFDAIERASGLSESEVIRLMRTELGAGAFKRWRKRVSGRSTKHDAHRSSEVTRHQAATHNKVNR